MRRILAAQNLRNLRIVFMTRGARHAQSTTPQSGLLSSCQIIIRHLSIRGKLEQS
jgi:hypothetical protein